MNLQEIAKGLNLDIEDNKYLVIYSQIQTKENILTALNSKQCLENCNITSEEWVEDALKFIEEEYHVYRCKECLNFNNKPCLCGRVMIKVMYYISVIMLIIMIIYVSNDVLSGK